MKTLSNNIDLTTIYNLADALANLYRQELINCNAVASRQLVNFQDDVVMEDDGLKVDFLLPDYWKEVELGRGPTQVPMGNVVYPAIKKWIDTKGIVPKPDKNGRIPSKDSLAYVITKKIHKQGYKGRKPLEKALNNPQAKAYIQQLINEIGNAMDKDITYTLLELSEYDTSKK